MHVWTARWVKHHATGNEVPPAEYTGYAGLPIRRLAGVLAGRMGPTPDLLCRDGAESEKLKPEWSDARLASLRAKAAAGQNPPKQ